MSAEGASMGLLAGLAAGGLGNYLVWLYRAEQLAVRRQAHGVPLVAGLAIGVATWLLVLGGRIADARIAGALGVLFATSLPAKGLSLLEPRFEGESAERWRTGVAAACGLLLALALPLARGTVATPAIGLIALAVVTLRLLFPVSGLVTVAGATLAAGLLNWGQP